MNELERTMTRYLLGELSESEQSALEARYFADPQVFNEILETESELVDGYVRGQLANEVRERFERSYMAHPERSERVKFAAALAARLDQAEAAADVEIRNGTRDFVGCAGWRLDLR
jgi:anti-sigma factor RsiW